MDLKCGGKHISLESRVKKLEKENTELKKSAKLQNTYIATFILTYIAVVPTLLRIMERINSDDDDLQFLIDLFERSGFEYDKFKDKHQQIFQRPFSPTKNAMDIVMKETEMFSDLVRRSYDSVLPEFRFDKSFFS